MKKAFLCAALLAATVFSGRSDAASTCVNGMTQCVFEFNTSADVPNGPFGNLTLDLLPNYNGSGVNAIQFTIDLVDSAFLVNTGNAGNHEPFGFNYTGGGAVTLSAFSVAGFSQGAGASVDQPPYGSYNVYVTANCQGGGPCAALGGNVLSFVATTPGGFAGLGSVVNGTHPFTADILYEVTGVVTTGPDPTTNTNSVPEPQSAALLGAGLTALAFASKKLRRK